MVFLGFLSGIITARYLGTEGRGIIALYQSFFIMLLPLFELGIRQSIAYFIGQKKYRENVLIVNMQWVYIVTVSLNVLTLIFVYHMTGMFVDNELVAVFFLLSAVVMLLNSYCQGVCVGRKQMDKVNYTLFLALSIYIFFLILFVIIFKQGVLGAAISWFIGQFVALIYISRVIGLSLLKKLPRKDIIVSLVKKGSIFAIALFVIELNYRIDVIMLKAFKGANSVGIYSVGVTLCEVLKNIPLSLGLVLFSHAANWSSDVAADKAKFVLLLSRGIFFVMIVLGLIFSLAMSYLLPIIYGTEFKGSVMVVNALLPGIVLLSVFLILNMFVAGQGKPHIALIVFLPALLFNIILNILLIPVFDYVGAAVSSTFSYAFAAMLYALIFKKIYKTNLIDIFVFKVSDFKLLLSKVKKNEV